MGLAEGERAANLFRPEVMKYDGPGFLDLFGSSEDHYR